MGSVGETSSRPFSRGITKKEIIIILYANFIKLKKSYMKLFKIVFIYDFFAFINKNETTDKLNIKSP